MSHAYKCSGCGAYYDSRRLSIEIRGPSGCAQGESSDCCSVECLKEIAERVGLLATNRHYQTRQTTT